MKRAVLFPFVLALAACGDSTEQPPPVPAGPSAPQDLVALAKDRQALITWAAVAGADSYNLYWTSDGTKPSKTSGNRITDPSSPFTHANLTNNTTYKYVVTARNSDGEGAESAVVSVTPGVGPLPPPDELRVGADDGQLTLSWDDVPLASGYDVYWTQDGSTPTTSSAVLTGVTSPYTHTGLTNGTEYNYAIASTSAAGPGPLSGVGSSTPIPGPFIGSVSLALQVCNADCCEDNSVGYAWWVEDADGSYLDTVVYYQQFALYLNASMPVWDAANDTYVDGLTEASVYNGQNASYTWDGRDRHGGRLPYGTYTMRFEITDWDAATYVTDTELTLGADGPTGTGSGTSSLTCSGLSYTYAP